MNKKYHLYQDNMKSGPFDAREILAAQSTRSGNGKMLIWSAELGDWKPLEDHLAQLKSEAASIKPAMRDDSPPAVAPLASTTVSSSAKKKSLVFGLAAIFIAAAVAGYVVWQKKAPQLVAGKILIVQKNAEVRKLALVKVEILNKEQTQRWAVASRSDLNELMDRSTKAAGLLEARLDAIMRDEPDMTSKYTSLGHSLYTIGANALLLNINKRSRRNETNDEEAKWMKEMGEHIAKVKFLLPPQIDSYVGDRDFFKIYLAVRFEGFNNLESLAKNDDPHKAPKFKKLVEDAAATKESFNESARSIMYGVPADIVRTVSETTDGDGQFAVKIPPDEYTIVTSSSRLVANSEEKYYWALGFTVSHEKENKVMLGNQNLESDDPRSHWKPETTLAIERLKKQISAIERKATKVSEEYKSPMKLLEEIRKELQELKDS